MVAHHKMMKVADSFGNPSLPGGGGDDINLPFIIGLSSSLSFILLIVLILAIYYIFFNDSLQSPDYHVNNLNIPDSFSAIQDEMENESLYLDKMSSDDQFYYKMSKKFQKIHKPSLSPMGQGIDLNVELLIRNRGLQCFYFEPYVDQLTELVNENDDDENETTPLINNQLSSTSYGSLVRNDIPFVTADKTDIEFLSSAPSSTILNLPLPTKNRHNDTIYFEIKLYEFDPLTTRLSLGLSTKPNPNFRLPGEYYYSFGLETTGHLKINRPLYYDDEIPVLTPQLVQSDVIGIGFKSTTGTVFITHNGKKKADIIKNLKTDLYPCIGSIGGPSKVQVNLGQSGFVFIEANVKKLGFCESNNDGNFGAPPMYNRVVKKEHKNSMKNNNSNSSSDNINSSASDIILEQGEALPPQYPEEEETFFGPKALLSSTSSKKNNNEIIIEETKKLPQQQEQEQEQEQQVPSKPPSYRSNTPSSNSDSSEKLVKILSTKLKKQQQIPDKLLDLNERYYEHSTSQFDKNENLNTDAGIDISGRSLQNLLIDDATTNITTSTSIADSNATEKVNTLGKVDEENIQESSSSVLINHHHHLQKKTPSPAPTNGSEATSSSSKDNHVRSAKTTRKKKKKSAKKGKKGKRNW